MSLRASSCGLFANLEFVVRVDLKCSVTPLLHLCPFLLVTPQTSYMYISAFFLSLPLSSTLEQSATTGFVGRKKRGSSGGALNVSSQFIRASLRRPTVFRSCLVLYFALSGNLRVQRIVPRYLKMHLFVGEEHSTCHGRRAHGPPHHSCSLT